MATYFTTHSGNLAIEQTIFTLSIDEAKAVKPLLNTARGTYWDSNFTRPLRSAQRSHAQSVRVYTGGFSAGEFSNALYASGVTANPETAP